MKKHLSAIVVAFLLGVIICGSVSAADLTVDKTAVKTGPDTATINIVANGSSSTATASADVVFAIDSSGSMGWNDPANLRLIAANNFIDKMNAGRDQAGAVDWSHIVGGTQPLTSNFALVKTFINGIGASGGTDLDVGLSASNDLLDTGGRPGVGHAIIFLTDGDGTYTPSGSPGSPVDYALSKGYVIYSVGLGSGVLPTNLEEMATVTGGKYYFAADASVLDSIFSDIFQDMITTATDIVVTDTIPNYVKLVGDPSVAPDSRVTNADGSTTFTWNVGTLSVGESWKVSYNVRSNKFGENLPTNLGATVSFTDSKGAQQTITLPIPRVSFEDPNDPGDYTKVNAATIGMQKTGVPLLGIVLAFLMVMGGLFVSKK